MGALPWFRSRLQISGKKALSPAPPPAGLHAPRVSSTGRRGARCGVDLDRRACRHLLPSFGRTVTPFATSKISHTSTNFLMLGKLDVFSLPAVGSRSRSAPALAVWGRTRPAAPAVPSEPAGQRAGDGEGPSVPSCSEAGGCPWRGPGGGHHTGPWVSPLCSQDPSGRSLVPLPLHSWPYPPPLRLHRSPPPSPTGVPRAAVPRSGFVPPFPTPSLDRASNLSAFPSPPPPAPPILPSAQGVP